MKKMLSLVLTVIVVLSLPLASVSAETKEFEDTLNRGVGSKEIASDQTAASKYASSGNSYAIRLLSCSTRIDGSPVTFYNYVYRNNVVFRPYEAEVDYSLHCYVTDSTRVAYAVNFYNRTVDPIVGAYASATYYSSTGYSDQYELKASLNSGSPCSWFEFIARYNP